VSKLEDLRPSASVKGILPDCLVTVVNTQWFGSEALELTYKDPSGRLANVLLYRHDENRIAVVELGRPWSFDGDGHLFRLVSEANRIRLAKSTHAGLPWLRHIRKKIGDKVHFWPFDGWAISNGKSAVVEVYPALWKREFLLKEVTSDHHDAYSVAAWLRQADIENTLHEFLEPNLSAEERNLAEVEDWILGVS